MPKQKTHSTSKKKFKVSAAGKLMRRAQMSGKLMNKSPKQKRQFSKDRPVDSANEKAVARLLGRR
jgi:large subunit ribosomal protein L35